MEALALLSLAEKAGEGRARCPWDKAADIALACPEPELVC
jgi:hypothetical protein